MVPPLNFSTLTPLPQGCIGREGTLRGSPRERRSDRRLEEVAEVVGGVYCRLQMPFSLALAIRETVAGHRPGPWRGEGGASPLTSQNASA